MKHLTSGLKLVRQFRCREKNSDYPVLKSEITFINGSPLDSRSIFDATVAARRLSVPIVAPEWWGVMIMFSSSQKGYFEGRGESSSLIG